MPNESPADASGPSLWRSGLHTLGTSVLSIPLGIASSIIVARALGPAGKGSYDLILATGTLLGIGFGLSLPSGVTYVVARRRARLGALAGRLTGIALAVGAAAAALLVAVRRTPLAPALIPPAGGWAIGAICVSLVATELANYWRAMLVGRQEIIRFNHRDLASRALHAGLLLAGVAIAPALGRPVTLGLVVSITLAATVLRSPILLHALRPSLRPDPAGPHPVDRSGLSEVLGFAIPCYFSNLVQFLNYRLDIFVVSFFAGVRAVGLYALAVTLAQLIWLISNAAATVLLPRVAAEQDAAAEIADRTARATRITLWVSAVTALLLALGAWRLLTVVYGESFGDSLRPLLYLLPGIVAFSTVNVIASYLAGIGKPRLNLWVSLVGLIVTIALDLLLIPRHGIVGAAVASSASYVTSAVMTLWLFTRESSPRLADVLLLHREDLQLLPAALGSVLPAARRDRR